MNCQLCKKPKAEEYVVLKWKLTLCDRCCNWLWKIIGVFLAVASKRK